MRRLVLPLALAGIVLGGALDYATGTELRVTPAYYPAIAAVAWWNSRKAALVAAGLSALTWVVANQLAGLSFSHPGIWVGNALIQGAAFAFLAVLISAVRAAYRRERALSRRDDLTGLHNTRAFHERAEQVLALARRDGGATVFAFLDLDNFKSVNDHRGHAAGDAVLREVAQALRGALRDSDVVARMGGDEFALVLPATDLASARAALERVLAAVTGAVAGATVPVGATIGAICYPRAPASVDAALSAADALMYRAKAAGKNRVVIEELAA